MERRDLFGSCFWAVIGVIFCAGSLRYGFGSAGVPGSGFMPFLTGLCLLSLSILQLLLFLTKRGSRPSPPPGRTDFPAKEKTKRVLVVLGALLFYGIALERLGFAVTSVLFMVVIIGLDVRKCRLVLLAAFSFTACFYILFKVLLRVPLPLGAFGI